MASVDPRNHQQAQFIHETCLKEGPIDVTASLQQERANSKILPELVHRLLEIDCGLSCYNVRNPLLLQHVEVVFWRLLADHANEVVPIQIAARPTELAERVHRDGIGFCPAGDKGWPTPGRFLGHRDEG